MLDNLFGGESYNSEYGRTLLARAAPYCDRETGQVIATMPAELVADLEAAKFLLRINSLKCQLLGKAAFVPQNKTHTRRIRERLEQLGRRSAAREKPAPKPTVEYVDECGIVAADAPDHVLRKLAAQGLVVKKPERD